MLIPTTYGSHQVRAECVIDIYMKFPTVFTMFVDLKTVCETK